MNISFPYDFHYDQLLVTAKSKRANDLHREPNKIYSKGALLHSKRKVNEENRTYQKMIQDKIEELVRKIANGDTETSYQIGGQSYTEREWNKLLEHFDAIEEMINKSIKEEIEERKERNEQEELQQQKAQDKKVEEERTKLLAMNQVSFECVEEGHEIRYVIAYDQNGMRCLKQGYPKEIWKLSFTDKQQYDKILEYLQDASRKEKANLIEPGFWISLIAKKPVEMEGEQEKASV